MKILRICVVIIFLTIGVGFIGCGGGGGAKVSARDCDVLEARPSSPQSPDSELAAAVGEGR